MPPGNQTEPSTPNCSSQPSIRDALVNFEPFHSTPVGKHQPATATVTRSSKVRDHDYCPEDDVCEGGSSESEDEQEQDANPDYEDPYPLQRMFCRVCHAKFPNYGAMICHFMDNPHDSPVFKPLSCSCIGCKVASRSLSEFIRHFQQRHLPFEEMPFECGINGCRMRFGHTGALNLHRIGSASRPGVIHFQPEDPDTHPKDLRCSDCNRFFETHYKMGAHARSCVRKVKEQQAQQRFLPLPFDGFAHKEIDGVQTALCPCCNKPVRCVAELIVHIRNVHEDEVDRFGRFRSETASLALRVQCHLCLETMTFNESVFHHLRCLALTFPEVLGPLMKTRATTLGLERAFLHSRKTEIRDQRCLMGDLLELQTSDDPAATVNIFRADSDVHRFLTENMEASANGAMYVIVQHDNQGVMTWDEFLKPGNIVYVGSAYGRLSARYHNHCQNTLPKWLQRYGPLPKGKKYYLVRLTPIMNNGSTVESFHKGDTLRLEEIMVIALGITSLRNSQHPMGAFTVDNDDRFHRFEKSLMKIAAVTLYNHGPSSSTSDVPVSSEGSTGDVDIDLANAKNTQEVEDMVAKWRELRNNSKEEKDARPSSSRTSAANVSEPRGSLQIARSSRQSSLREWFTPLKLASGPDTTQQPSNLSEKAYDHQSVLSVPKTTNVTRRVSRGIGEAAKLKKKRRRTESSSDSDEDNAKPSTSAKRFARPPAKVLPKRAAANTALHKRGSIYVDSSDMDYSDNNGDEFTLVSPPRVW